MTGDELVWRRPPAPLRPFVDLCSGYRMAATPPGTHQGVPGAHLTFLLCLDGDVEVLQTPGAGRGPGRFDAMVAGLHHRPAVMAQGPAQTGIQLRLTWRGARMLLGVPAAALAGDVVDLRDVLGRGAVELRERLATAPSWAHRFAVLDRELTRLAASSRAPEPAPEVARAWDVLAASGGTVRVEALARDLGWSRRHLATRFHDELGVSPKTAARVIRFERACDMLRSGGRDPGRRPALADVAARCGYADQPHLARDFRELGGTTATRWLAERPT
ncbi:Helix-turn-helix, AraC domain protein [Pseudonocardia dioxanivorans CB1190]|uniref:Helix-turn-helix, AraC domain protein n=1 Tax=Pseudonocardia dioxanivorans (strain ATCC 55486 / DSM 44775 / JCM 13855 / CB1190) TaxID=675635 RepID=F4D0H8_PSEUX|nr:helix-turn-helix transcriptional regulator [Pseudonocardia dioxanivorans]AEA26774.1 Helix-turn-helix, AraC domain protein [Pseudonocardia dioxanivorans CB1190]